MKLPVLPSGRAVLRTLEWTVLLWVLCVVYEAASVSFWSGRNSWSLYHGIAWVCILLLNVARIRYIEATKDYYHGALHAWIEATQHFVLRIVRGEEIFERVSTWHHDDPGGSKH